ncbi:hypothetical protein NUW58_g1992 [Xylaria curta]|uniref:Uncharacterized protein n=1 Tax=Xylaria curta TaxID=42375 RepID=A0ACC1PJH4_9PEZI|nr:hypothetical protein NUW58_g1992 [Xylaria curta]
MEVEQSLKNEKESREEESILHENSIIHLQTKLKEMEQHLEMEQSRHKKTRSDLIETQKDVKHHRQLALDAVGELNRFLRGNQVPNQSTDDEIIQRAMMLRVDIRDFAIIHFEGSIDEVGINQVSLESLNEFLRIPPDCLKEYVSNSSTRVNIIRAFLWMYLCERVFNRFSWTWRGAGSAFHDICGFLEGLMNENENGDYQGKRKFHTWRANTASLLVEAMSLDETAANCELSTSYPNIEQAYL